MCSINMLFKNLPDREDWIFIGRSDQGRYVFQDLWRIYLWDYDLMVCQDLSSHYQFICEFSLLICFLHMWIWVTTSMLYKFYFISLSSFYLEIIFQFWLLLFYVIVNILLLLLLLFVVVRNLTSSFCVCLCSFFGGGGGSVCYRVRQKILNWRVTLIVWISYVGTPNMLIWLQLHQVTRPFVCGMLVVSDYSVVQFILVCYIIRRVDKYGV